jgi:uncharacterized membrane protein (DUF4010 family)
LLALLGAVAGWLTRELSSPWILAAAVLVVGAFVTAGYFVNAKPDPDAKGLTTEVAAPVVFLLCAMVMLGEQELAIGLGVVTAACSPTNSRSMASSRSSAGTMSMPACGC